MDVLNKIAACETVISSSLHGLVAADSLNIPNLRIKLSNHNFKHNIDFKFDDYYSAISDDTIKFINFIENPSLENLKLITPQMIEENYTLDYQRIQQQQQILLQKGNELKEML